MKVDEFKKPILEEIAKYGDKGASRNKITVAVTGTRGGSRTTMWAAINKLIEEDEIESRVVGKQQEHLFLTASRKKVLNLRKKLKLANDLLDLLDKYPGCGDCFTLHVNNKIPKMDIYQYDQVKLYSNFVENTEFMNNDGAIVYSLQARHDILRDLPSFLIYYINDPENNFSTELKRKIFCDIDKLTIKCAKKLQSEYTISYYYSDRFYKNLKNNVQVHSIRGLASSNIQSEFLRTLGRYYFSISKELSKYVIDSCKEHVIISKFAKSFFNRSAISDKDLSDSINEDDIIEHWLRGSIPLPPTMETTGMSITGKRNGKVYVEIIKPTGETTSIPITGESAELEDGVFLCHVKNGPNDVIEKNKLLDKISRGLAGNFGRKFDKYENNDAFIVFNFYSTWAYSLKIFSEIEIKCIEKYVSETESYDKHLKHEEHDDPYEGGDYPDKDVRGFLFRSKRSYAGLRLNIEYIDLRPYAGKHISVLMVNDEVEL